jgi:hypothetical protein
MSKNNFFSIFNLSLITCAILFCFGDLSPAQIQIKQSLLRRYSDPKGFFKIIPPIGWRIQDYQQDPRGKVAFYGSEKNVELRILAKGAEFDTFDELVDAIKKVEDRTGISSDHERIDFLGRLAIKRVFNWKGSKLLSIDFIEGNATHNIMYAAPLNLYDKYFAIAMRSIETYETIRSDVSTQELEKHRVAQKLRLSQLASERGEFALALDYANEGLEIRPENIELLRLKEQLEENLKKQ